MKFALSLCLAIFCSTTVFAQSQKKSAMSEGGDAVDVKYQTQMDFDSTMIDGKMKAPSGFFLQGRNKQSLQSMVKLRTDFREELRNSRSAIKAMVR